MSIRLIIAHIILLLSALSISPASAQYDFTVAQDSIIDITDRTIPKDKIDDYRSKSEYNYDEDPDYETNILSSLWMAFKRFLKKIFGNGGYSLLGDILYYLLIAAASVILLYYLVKSAGVKRIFGREDRSQTALKAELIDENSSLDSIDTLIANAEAENNYRLSTRLLYLKTLRLLDDRELIQWKTGKTNINYLVELKNQNHKDALEELIYIFEYCWYGQFEINSLEQYNQLKSSFTSYYKSIEI